MTTWLRLAVPAALLAVLAGPALAEPSPGMQCETAIRTQEAALAIPPGLLGAIGVVETGRVDRAAGRVRPWPWSIDASGQDFVFDSKPDAIAAVHRLQAQGVASIDVGCMQVNLVHHPSAFASLEEAFDPARNVAYAARFLVQLYAEARDWQVAAAHYHSRTPELADPYARRVKSQWMGTPPQARSALLLPPPTLIGRIAAKPLPMATLKVTSCGETWCLGPRGMTFAQGR